MESLTRNNYEIWFLDYLDGQLSNEQLETLLDFLEQNPDLKQELTGVSGISLAAGSESLDQRDRLLKTQDDIPGIATMDQLCIARMENDLTEEDARQFDVRLGEDLELRGSYAAFMNTRLNSAEKVVFPYKNDLRKKTVIFTPWLITAISSAAIILLAWILWPDQSEPAAPEMAKTETPAAQTPAADSTAVIATPPSTITPSQNPANLLTSNLLTSNHKPSRSRTAKTAPEQQDILPRETFQMKSLSRKSSLAGPRIPEPQSTKLLYASNYPAADAMMVPAEDLLTVPQYALQLFREKILGEDRSLVKKTRFSMWEVAGAGVNKINDLAGTKMKLNREYDSKGDILAVSFNSRFIDVERPVRAQPER